MFSNCRKKVPDKNIGFKLFPCASTENKTSREAKVEPETLPPTNFSGKHHLSTQLRGFSHFRPAKSYVFILKRCLAPPRELFRDEEFYFFPQSSRCATKICFFLEEGERRFWGLEYHAQTRSKLGWIFSFEARISFGILCLLPISDTARRDFIVIGYVLAADRLWKPFFMLQNKGPIYGWETLARDWKL